MTTTRERRTDAVGVIGLGKMGGPLAGHLVAAGHDVVGLDPGSVTAPEGVQRVGGVGDMARCGTVLVTVPGAVVADVLLEGSALRSELQHADVVVCSTVGPTAMGRLHGSAAATGTALLDAPLCRGDHGARAGTLLALVGGSGDVLARVRPLLDTFCSDVEHVGGPGAGQTAKLVNNLLLWTHLAAVAEGLRLAEGLGVHRAPLVEALRRSSAASWVLETWSRPREMPWADEDLRMALAEAAEVGVEVPLAARVAAVVEALRASGLLRDGGLADLGWVLPAYPDAARPT